MVGVCKQGDSPWIWQKLNKSSEHKNKDEVKSLNNVNSENKQ